MKTIMLAGAVIIGWNTAQAAIESPELVRQTLENLPAEVGRRVAGTPEETTEYFLAADTAETPDVLTPAPVRMPLPGESVASLRTREPFAAPPSVRAVGNVIYLAQAPPGALPQDPLAPAPPVGPQPPGASPFAPAPGVPGKPMRMESQVVRGKGGQGMGSSVTANRLEMIVDRQGGEGRSLVISSHEPEPKSMAAAEEDLNVMSRILEKAMEQKSEDGERRVMGIRVSQGGDGLKNMLIEDYGVIFMLRANFPLSGPPEKKTDNRPKETTNSAWEQARREVYGGPRGLPGSDFDRPPTSPVEYPFDPKRVENLKESLLESLKNASNIRGLKEDDSIVVVVRSGDGGGDTYVRRMVIERGPEGVKMTGPGGDEPPKVGSRPKSTLTIKAKKADIDAFAKGKMDKPTFQKKVSMSLY